MKSLACVAALLCAAPVFAASLTVEAGDYDRRDCVVEFKLRPGSVNLFLKAEGKEFMLQGDREGNAWFVLDELKRRQRKTYELHFAPQVGAGSVHAVCAGEEYWNAAMGERTNCKGPVRLMIPGPPKERGRMSFNTVLTYQTEKTEFPPGRTDLKPIYQRGGYIHPVLSPSGKQITDDYPVNHKHHHGLWFAWTHTEFEGRTPDFWNMGDGKGFVEFAALDKTWSGPVHAGFISQHRQMDTTEKGVKPKTALLETWNVKLYAVGTNAARPYYLFDMEITDKCAHGPVKLPKYRYGGIGVRGNWAWNGKDKLNFLNSEGVSDRSKGEEGQTVGRWAHMGGPVDGSLTGIAVLDHPDNVRAPQPQRIHPTEPFLNIAPQQAGDVEITPEKPLTLRYRFVVADGAPDKAELDRLWNDYAHPPKVTVTEK